MQTLKDQIKSWLKHHNRDREWLASKLGKKLQTINNWLSSSKPIPENCIALIKRLMADDDAAEAQRRLQLLPTNQIFSLEVDLPTFRAFNAAALAAGKTLEQWCIDSINAAAEAAANPATAEDHLRKGAAAFLQELEAQGTTREAGHSKPVAHRS